MIVATIVIVVVWTALFGTACAARRLGRVAAVGAVTACYVAAASLALHWLGWGAQGMLGAAGMLVPYAAAVAIAIVRRRDRRKRVR